MITNSINSTHYQAGGLAIHAETVCQGPVISKSPENVGACNGYNGPNLKPVLPKIGQRVMVTGISNWDA